MTRRFTLQAATELAARAIRAAGASDDAALSLARATVSANAHGKGSSGFSHLMDYLAALRAGRIVGDAEPLVTSPAPAAIHCDAKGGIAQAASIGLSIRSSSARATFGLALFAQNGSYTTGELGYYPRRLADAGLVAFAATSGPALMTVAGAKTPVYCTNPIAFAAPLDEGPPLLIDQASSATAFVQLRHYAERGETLPAGWAVNADGEPTTDPQAALRGALLAFGGARGANIALMVEVMAAGLAGANWALDAPSFTLGRPLARRRPPRHRHHAGAARAGLSPALEAPARPARQAWRSYSRTTRRRGRNRIARRARRRDRARRGALKRLRRKRLENRRSGGQGAAKWRSDGAGGACLKFLAGLPFMSGLARGASAAAPPPKRASVPAIRHGRRKRNGISSTAMSGGGSSRCARRSPPASARAPTRLARKCSRSSRIPTISATRSG